MSLSASRCSKGCESGWTVYLGESSSHFPVESNGGGRKSKAAADDDVGEEEEENLSMVSDASSGPPSHEVEDEYSNERCSKGKCRSKSKGQNKGAKGEPQHLSYYYEDTACSPHLKCTEKEKTESQNFHRNKNSASAPPEKANSGRKGGLKNRKWA